MNPISILIDGTSVTAHEGESVLIAALKANIYIPHLCFHPDLPPQAECKLCTIEVEGIPEPVSACDTIVKDGMVVRTNSMRIDKLRRVALSFLLADHPKDCKYCKIFSNCEVLSLIQKVGINSSLMRESSQAALKPNIVSPLIESDMNLCILCGRCVRACKDLRGVGVLQYNKDGHSVYIGTKDNLPLAKTNCRYCGACIDVCPTGAIRDRSGILREDLPFKQALVPCSAQCPAHIDIPRFVNLVNKGQYTQAAAVVKKAVPFPATLGHVCDYRCEKVCRRSKLDDPISIRALERFVAGYETTEDDFVVAPDTRHNVAIIGSGPAGLSAAQLLRKAGHKVTVFERLPVAGGLLTTGIPKSRLPQAVVQSEIDAIVRLGVKIQCGHNVKNITELRQQGFDAILVATGTSKGYKLTELNGWQSLNATTAIEVLRNVSLGTDMDLGTNICIIGGGSVGMDCAQVLAERGKKVTVICPESRDAMSADKKQIDICLRAGVDIRNRTGVKKLTTQGDCVVAVNISGIIDAHFDEAHTLVARLDPDLNESIRCDTVVFAIGQAPDLMPEFGIRTKSHGWPVVDPEKMTTSEEGVFIAGDAIDGTHYVIDAIISGQKAASQINRYLGCGDMEIALPISCGATEACIGVIPDFSNAARQMLQANSNSFSACLQAEKESARCLQCSMRLDTHDIKPWTSYAV